jgi:hypothetical protein
MPAGVTPITSRSHLVEGNLDACNSLLFDSRDSMVGELLGVTVGGIVDDGYNMKSAGDICRCDRTLTDLGHGATV